MKGNYNEVKDMKRKDDWTCSEMEGTQKNHQNDGILVAIKRGSKQSFHTQLDGNHKGSQASIKFISKIFL